MRDGVRADLVARLVQVPGLAPVHNGVTDAGAGDEDAAQESGWQEKRRPQPKALQQRHGHVYVVPVPVVESKADQWTGAITALPLTEVPEQDDVVSLAQVLQVPFEGGRVDPSGETANGVVGEDAGARAPTRCGQAASEQGRIAGPSPGPAPSRFRGAQGPSLSLAHRPSARQLRTLEF